MTAYTRLNFANAVTVGLGLSKSIERAQAFVGWETAENAGALFNPLGCTLRLPGSTDYNKVGVQNYTSFKQGVAATVTMLNNGNYPKILKALMRGTGPGAVADAVATSPWGTGNVVYAGLSQAMTNWDSTSTTLIAQ